MVLWVLGDDAFYLQLPVGLEGGPAIVPGLSHMVGVDWQSAAPGQLSSLPVVAYIPSTG